MYLTILARLGVQGRRPIGSVYRSAVGAVRSRLETASFWNAGRWLVALVRSDAESWVVFRRTAVAVAVMLALTWVARWWIDARPNPSLAARTHTTEAGAPAQFVHLTAFDSDGVSDDAKLALVEQLASDSSSSATDVLVEAADSPSLLVSMASIRALGRRPCEQISEPLGRHLDDAAWQRRAWAAKVLAESRCGAARDLLARRLGMEQDARVRRQLASVLDTLGTAR